MSRKMRGEMSRASALASRAARVLVRAGAKFFVLCTARCTCARDRIGGGRTREKKL